MTKFAKVLCEIEKAIRRDWCNNVSNRLSEIYRRNDPSAWPQTGFLFIWFVSTDHVGGCACYRSSFLSCTCLRRLHVWRLHMLRLHIVGLRMLRFQVAHVKVARATDAQVTVARLHMWGLHKLRLHMLRLHMLRLHYIKMIQKCTRSVSSNHLPALVQTHLQFVCLGRWSEALKFPWSL